MNIKIRNLGYNIDKLINNCKSICGNFKICLDKKDCSKFCEKIEYYLEKELKPKNLAWIESERMKQILYK